MRTDRTVTFVLVPLADLAPGGEGGFAAGEWLVWQDHTERGVVGRLPAEAGEIAATMRTVGDEGALAAQALGEVIHSVWGRVAD